HTSRPGRPALSSTTAVRCMTFDDVIAAGAGPLLERAEPVNEGTMVALTVRVSSCGSENARAWLPPLSRPALPAKVGAARVLQLLPPPQDGRLPILRNPYSPIRGPRRPGFLASALQLLSNVGGINSGNLRSTLLLPSQEPLWARCSVRGSRPPRCWAAPRS